MFEQVAGVGGGGRGGVDVAVWTEGTGHAILLKAWNWGLERFFASGFIAVYFFAGGNFGLAFVQTEFSTFIMI